MKKEVEVLIWCAEVFESMGVKRLPQKIATWIESSNDSNLENLLDEVQKWKDYAVNSKGRFFVFGDGQHTLMKFFIISYQKEWAEDGSPAIVINKLEDETASFKDNPIKNLWVKYPDEEMRDIDFERLMTMK